MLGSYVLLFPAIYSVIDHLYFILGLLPIALAGLLLGFRAAIYTVFAISVIHFGLLAGPLETPIREALIESLPLVTLLIGGTIGYLRDVRTTLTQHRNELERRNEHLEEFARVLGHDLRNPLNVAMFRLEFATDECESEHLDQVSTALGRMEELIDDTLTLALAGEAVRETETVELSTLIDACWRNVETDSTQLATETVATMRADETLLQHLFENLFRNAVEHGGADVTITVGDLPDGFYVEDDGQGIPVEDRNQILETGYSTSETGTGFGLSIVRNIAAAHGWDIDVTASEAGGARFEFTGVQTG